MSQKPVDDEWTGNVERMKLPQTANYITGDELALSVKTRGFKNLSIEANDSENKHLQVYTASFLACSNSIFRRIGPPPH